MGKNSFIPIEEGLGVDVGSKFVERGVGWEVGAGVG